MACKVEVVVCYGHIEKKIALYVPRFKSGGPMMSEVKSWDFFYFPALAPKLVLALEATDIKLERIKNKNKEEQKEK